jgi:receptor protein-tyrosine kinase
MIAPKQTHLVERAAERLLRAGALDGSAAQLLEPDRRPLPVPPPPFHAPPLAAPPLPIAPAVTDPIAAPAIPAEALVTELPPASADAAPGAGVVPARPVIDIAALERAGVFDWTRGRSRISEEFRLAQRQVMRNAFEASAQPGLSNLLMVTSARPGEGKSFTALNLAASIALQGDHHVLLIDSDSKRDSICQAFGLADAAGVLDLAGSPTTDPGDVILKTQIEGLSFLPVGQERNRSSELFASKDMTQLVQSLGRRYADRLIILDAPPCLSASDPAALAPVVGQIVFVIEAERTQRDEVEASLDLIQACPTIMLLLNKVQVSTRYTFGAYSAYYSS